MSHIQRKSWLRSRPVMLALVVALLLGSLPGIALAAPAESSDQRVSAHYTYYTVRYGDSLSKIAERHGTTVSALMQLNGIYNKNHIYVGQKLKIPTSSSGCSRYHTVAYGETLSHIAVWYGVSQYTLASVNNLSNYHHVWVGQRLCIPGTGGPAPSPPPSGGFWYTVRLGDTVSKLAYRYGTTVQAIVNANGLWNANRIEVGHVLWIPGSGYQPKPPTPKPPAPKPPTPNPPASSVWTGTYYNNRDFSGAPALVRADSAVNFDWGLGSPAPGVNSNDFSAIWSTSTYFSAGTYRFYATSDDGVRVYVDGHLVIDGWGVHPVTSYFGDIYLNAGNHTVRVEYFEAGEFARIAVSWSKL